MAPPSDLTYQPESDYPEISLPDGGWKSNIPAHLMTDVAPPQRWLMEEMSKNTQATDFSCRAAVEANGLIRKTNGRLKGAEAQIVDLRSEVAQLKADNVALKAQVSAQAISIAPITTTVANARAVFKSKLALAILIGALLFALGYNREQALALWQAIKG